MPDDTGKDEGSTPPESRTMVATPDESTLQTWLESLLNRPTATRSPSSDTWPQDTNPMDGGHASRLVFRVEVGPLVNTMGRIGKCLDATDHFLRALELDYKVHEVRFSNRLTFAIDIETSAEEATKAGTPVAVTRAAHHIVRAIERLAPETTKADRERETAKALTELVKQLGRDDVDLDELSKRTEALLELDIRASSFSNQAADRDASTEKPIDLRVVPTDDQGG